MRNQYGKLFNMRKPPFFGKICVKKIAINMLSTIFHIVINKMGIKLEIKKACFS